MFLCFPLKDSDGRVFDQYKANYAPIHHDLQPKMFNSRAVQREGHMDQLQREFLDSTQRTSPHLVSLSVGTRSFSEEYWNTVELMTCVCVCVDLCDY